MASICETHVRTIQVVRITKVGTSGQTIRVSSPGDACGYIDLIDNYWNDLLGCLDG